MNFLNPLALIGLVAAGIPVLLHLLNLRRLKTVEFSTLRFLQELQQTRVRKLRVQQILLLILRTLLVICAVLAFARPTIQTRLPLLSSSERTSVVILIDNSASMEAADQKGRRLRQAQDAAQEIVGRLTDGDEVCVITMAARDPYRNVGFTRTFAQASEEIERAVVSVDRADVPGSLRLVSDLLKDAAHAYHEVYVVSDAQRSTLARSADDTTIALNQTANVFLVRIGNALQGLEQNLSVDSINVLTKLFQPNKAIEVEAVIRNGSDRDATGVAVSMAFDGVRVSQRAIDVPAGASRSVVLAAPPQRRGIVAASIELDNDAIDGDNVRYAGVMIPPKARIGIVGRSIGADLVQLALELQDSPEDRTAAKKFTGVDAIIPELPSLDVVYLVDGTLSESQTNVFKQFVERGGGLVVFASEQSGLIGLLAEMGLSVGNVLSAPEERPWRITSLDESHPLFQGVFNASKDRSVVESPQISRMRPASGGVEIASTDAGACISEGALGSGRVIYIAFGPDRTWGSFAGTGLFAATVVRSSLYSSMPRDQGMETQIGRSVSAPVPGRYAGEAAFVVKDNLGIPSTLTPARLPTATLLMIPAQRQAGVVRVNTMDSLAVMTVSVNAPVEESILTYMDDAQWSEGVSALVSDPDRVVVTPTGRALEETVRAARVGSELWPLFVILAVAFAVMESLVSRFLARDETAGVSP